MRGRALGALEVAILIHVAYRATTETEAHAPRTLKPLLVFRVEPRLVQELTAPGRESNGLSHYFMPSNALIDAKLSGTIVSVAKPRLVGTSSA